MTPLRQKMIREMDLKNLSHHIRRSYLNAVTGLAKHYRQSPETITKEMIEDYLLYLKNEKGNALATCCITLTGLRFFYKHILEQQISIGFSLPKTPRKLPTVLTKQQVGKIICAPGNLKHRLTPYSIWGNWRLCPKRCCTLLFHADRSRLIVAMERELKQAYNFLIDMLCRGVLKNFVI